MKFKSFLPELLLFLLVVLYVLLMVFNTNYGPIEDHAYLFTLDKGKFLFWFNDGLKSGGRFMLLYGQDFNFMNLLFKNCPKPLSYYLILSVEYVLGIVFLYKNLIISTNQSRKYLIVFFIFLFSLSISMTTTFFRLTYVERNIFLFFSVAIFLYHLYHKTDHIFYLIAGIICANLSLYFKEVAFLSIGAWGVFNFVFNYQNKIRRNTFNILLVASSILYLVLYAILVFPYIKGRYGLTSMSFFENFIKSFVEFTIGDPFLILVIFTLFLFRVFTYVSGKNKEINPFYDSLLIAALAYILGFFLLRMVYCPSYLIPAYAFALPVIAYYLLNQNYIQKTIFRVVVTIALLIQFLNLPLGINQIFFHKQNNLNFQLAMAKLSNEIRTKTSKTKLVILGGRDVGGEPINSTITNLFYRGCQPQSFDVLSSENVSSLSIADTLSPFTVFRDTTAYFPSHNDYILYTPYTVLSIKDERITKDAELVFSTKSYILPNIGIKSIIRWFILQTSYGHLIRNQNDIVEPNYYIFRKK